MKLKHVVAVAAMSLMVTGAASAAIPVTHVTKDKVGLGVDYGFDLNATGQAGHHTGVTYGVDYGISNKTAVQYSFSKNDIHDNSMRDHHLDVVYAVVPHFNLYGGVTHLKGLNDSATGVEGGAIAYAPIFPGAGVYAKLGTGTNLRYSYQVGVSYKIIDNLELNGYYMSERYHFDEGDGTLKGLHVGLGYKF